MNCSLRHSPGNLSIIPLKELSRACRRIALFECPFVLEGFVKIAYIIEGESLQDDNAVNGVGWFGWPYNPAINGWVTRENNE